MIEKLISRDIEGEENMKKSTEITTKKETWFSTQWPRVYRFFYYRVQNKEEAEELAQETFHRVFRQAETGGIRDNEKQEVYLFATARNLMTDLWRKRGRNPRPLSVEGLQEKGWDPPGWEQQEVEEKLMVQEALSQLNPDYRKVLTYRIIEGWLVKEVAEKMKRSPGAIRSLQFRALQALKEILEKGGYFHE